MHFFTSITTNYLPKARVLAHSVKKYRPNSWFTLLVCDKLPDEFNIENESFDEVWFIEDLGLSVSNLNQWIFQHTVVELCTAVKGQAMVKILESGKHSKGVYLDPDTVVFDDLSELEKRLDEHSIILTPHLTAPEKDIKGIMDNEICTLQHGTYNLGFLAVRKSENGLAFAKWWSNRLQNFCFDDIPKGIFTDQRWVDLVPAIFDDVYIERSPAYNVSTWNLSNRVITKKNSENKYLVNNIPLQFYHFSGFDSGAQEVMLGKYGNSDAAFELRNWYIERQDQAGQNELGKTPGKYNYFSNGEPITKHQRYIMRIREDVQNYFEKSNPFEVIEGVSYYSWYKNEILDTEDLSSEQKSIRIKELEEEVARLRRYLNVFRPFKIIYDKFFKGN